MGANLAAPGQATACWPPAGGPPGRRQGGRSQGSGQQAGPWRPGGRGVPPSSASSGPPLQAGAVHVSSRAQGQSRGQTPGPSVARGCPVGGPGRLLGSGRCCRPGFWFDYLRAKAAARWGAGSGVSAAATGRGASGVCLRSVWLRWTRRPVFPGWALRSRVWLRVLGPWCHAAPTGLGLLRPGLAPDPVSRLPLPAAISPLLTFTM